MANHNLYFTIIFIDQHLTTYLKCFFLVFKKDYPARICYQAAKLPLGANIEIEALALTGPVKTETIIDALTKTTFPSKM